MVDFLEKSACFDELDPQMLDQVLNRQNTRLIFENLVSRNIFTTKTGEGFYRYHSLFRHSLLKTANQSSQDWLQQKAARYYFFKPSHDLKIAGIRTELYHMVRERASLAYL
jgi:LuxR family maltose regulon positive regulatory protein